MTHYDNSLICATYDGYAYLTYMRCKPQRATTATTMLLNSRPSVQTPSKQSNISSPAVIHNFV